MKAIYDFDNNIKNNWNKMSVNFRYSDLDKIEDMKVVTLFDDENRKIVDAEFYTPQNKAYIVLNRVHFGENYQDNKVDALNKLFAFLFFSANRDYIASAIYMNILSSNISDADALEVGFFRYGNSIDILALLNWSFLEMLDDKSLDQEVRTAITQDFLALKAIKLVQMEDIRKQLLSAKAALSFFKMEDTPNQVLLDAKEQEIKHLESILESNISR